MSMSALSSTEASPAHSPSLSPTTGRRLSSRRGSASAADPWGAHSAINNNPLRSSSSRLTIVRVPPSGEQPEAKLHRRHGSNASLNSASSKGEGPARMSFAFTTFTPVSSQPGGRSSPLGSPRMRPASPGGMSSFSGGGASLSRGPSVSLPNRDKLSPEKLVELVRTSCNPRPAGTSAPLPTPVSFRPLPDDVYLPFIDRPGEVATLIATQPSSKLFALLSQTFPPDARASASANPSAATPSIDSDPTKWTYAELENWLRKVPREEVEDAVWVRKARKCILPRSELIWERIKGALGIPPELDTDEPEEDPLQAYLPPPIPIPSRHLPLTSNMLDSDVFEPDSPDVAANVPPSHPPVVDVDAPDSPGMSELELSIEPVLAAPPPPPSTVDPTTGANMTSLHELREEDEEEQEDGNKSTESSVAGGSAEVHGLRISTSASVPSYSPDIGPHSFGAGRGASPSPVRLENEGAYDALNERGPGHPLFPSSFAHLSIGPTLRTTRASSMSYPPPPALALRRADSHGAVANRGRNLRPDWARGWDAVKHEDAITTSSID